VAIDEIGAPPGAETPGPPGAEAPDPPGAGVTPSTPSATGIRSGAHWIVFFGLAGLVLVLDQVTKAWLTSNVSPGDVVRVLGDYVRLVFSQNSGALFGLFRDNAVLFGIVSIAVIGLIIVYHGRVGRSLYLSIALGLLLGGALGNMTDRLRLGYVVDFVDMGIGDFRWYTFNVADAAISTSIVMLIGAALIPSLVGLGERRSDG
jgi:signal peptidase II